MVAPRSPINTELPSEGATFGYEPSNSRPSDRVERPVPVSRDPDINVTDLSDGLGVMPVAVVARARPSGACGS